jgi:polynucleotide 5'-hydroxyl-kinase GRC3/NOL9
MDQIDTPSEWAKLPFDEMKGLTIVVGAANVGKSTLAKYLFWQLNKHFKCVGFLDGDPGQSSLGPPTTFTLAVSDELDSKFPPEGKSKRMFIGSVSPRGHMLRVVIAAARLSQAALNSKVKALIYDTSGFVDSFLGGHALKQAKIDLLRPSYLVAIQKEDELERLLTPIRKSKRVRVFVMKPSPAVLVRNLSVRQAYRTERFKDFFNHAQSLEMGWGRFPIFPYPKFALNRLLAFEDVDGFVLSLGIIEKIDRVSKTLTIFTPLESLVKVNALHLGNVLVEPGSFHDSRMEVR